MTGKELFEAYRGRAIVHSRDVFLFPTLLALEFVDDCQNNALRLLGYDAFQMLDGGFLQVQDYLDVSMREFWDYSVEELCDMVRQRIGTRPELVFEFVLDD